jgi:hypothetical protein
VAQAGKRADAAEAAHAGQVEVMRSLIARLALGSERETSNRFPGEDALMRRLICAALAFGLLLANHSPALAFPSLIGPLPDQLTLRGDARVSAVILYGTFANPRRSVNSTGDKEEAAKWITDFHILKVIKTDPALGKRNVIEIPRYVPVPDPRNPPKFLVFVDVYKGELEPYRGVKVDSAAVLDYLKEALALDDKDPVGALRYFFRYLDHADQTVADDAFREFARADYQDLRAAAKFFPAEKLARWLRDSKTPAERLRIYALLLGQCGKEEHANLLRGMLDDPKKCAGFDGMLAAYTMLKPADGWAHLKRILGNEKEDFRTRYAALRAVRFFWENTTDVAENKKLDKKDFLEGLCLLLNQGDIDDIAVECLRQWQRWERTEQVLELFNQKTRNLSAITKRAILLFAMAAEKSRHPAQAKAKAFVARMRQADPDWVSDTAELLELEQEPAPQKAPAPIESK